LALRDRRTRAIAFSPRGMVHLAVRVTLPRRNSIARRTRRSATPRSVTSASWTRRSRPRRCSRASSIRVTRRWRARRASRRGGRSWDIVAVIVRSALRAAPGLGSNVISRVRSRCEVTATVRRATAASFVLADPSRGAWRDPGFGRTSSTEAR
jgi:hypothetical protein